MFQSINQVSETHTHTHTTSTTRASVRIFLSDCRPEQQGRTWKQFHTAMVHVTAKRMHLKSRPLKTTRDAITPAHSTLPWKEQKAKLQNKTKISLHYTVPFSTVMNMHTNTGSIQYVTGICISTLAISNM